ncbi:hypothetical protein Z517_09178 [Fonsecaea pedrosoi CBS 271.37]|uniref:Major facilitator superfamily (MFS) profile domain-containing protein n=1 Tax=Fonsecaea pedrosoi CBS 271.37 TaxID=1442368 RepID=A0A0D2GWI9_9EURO|nr:uncharacterized protein Z517_09178 [Fonsecaea pedrosoi CBS 271.37]KIW76734.1 hypothetical protein Z517_09178 [Fonsecaea pedrosoi CBS 271.37]
MANKAESLTADPKPNQGPGATVFVTKSILTTSDEADADAATKHTKSRPWRSVLRYVWDDPGKSKEEKWFLLKLDLCLLSISCLGYFSKSLDQANINNAYVSGMKEALHMDGSELTYASNVFTAGYVLGQLPAVILARHVRPSILLPTMELLWTVFTFCMSAVTTTSQMYGLRFLLAVCEGTYFPSVVYIIGSWYTKRELAKRMTIFYATAPIAAMFSGYLQAGAYKGLNGRLGHSGWQWLFIICGVVSLPIALIGYVLFPDFPETTRAIYLTERERELARARMLNEGMKPLGASAWNRTKIFKLAKQWQFWLLPLGYFFVQTGFPVQQPAFALWLKSTNHTVYEINVWTTGQFAVAAVSQVVAGMLSDSPLFQGRRWQSLLLLQVPCLIGSIIIAVWDVPDSAKFTSYYLCFTAMGVPGIYFSWFSSLIPHDHEFRGFVIATSNMFSYIMGIWWTLTVWRTVLAPKFHAAFIASSCLGCALIVLAFVIRVLEKRDQRKRAAAAALDAGTGVDDDEDEEKTTAKDVNKLSSQVDPAVVAKTGIGLEVVKV